MDLFDLHCDTLYECFNSNLQLKSNNLAISLEKGRCFKHWGQVFAIFTPDSLRGQAAVDHYNKMVTLFKEQVTSFSYIIAFVLLTLIGGKMIKEFNIPMNNKLLFFVGACEEDGMDDIADYVKNETIPDLSIVLPL